MSDGFYYQLGGFKGQIRAYGYDDKELALAVAGPSSPLRENGRVELVLGIKRSGSSHLLVHSTQIIKLHSGVRRPEGRPLHLIHFESLSPIHFYSDDELLKKLSSLKPGKKSDGRDTSQANKAYSDDHEILYRGVYEHGRVVYSLLNNLINPTLFGVNNSSWQQKLCIKALVFNIKSVDDRKYDEKIRNPFALDVGICDGLIPSFEPNFSTAKHLIYERWRALGGGRGRPRKPFQYGPSRICTDDEVSTAIQAVFKNHQGPTDNPMVLLIFNEELSKNYLRNLGVNMQGWRDGLRELLIKEDGRPAHRNEVPQASSSTRDPRLNRYDPRARSPRREQSDFQSNRRRSPDERPSPENPLYPPVFVVDVKQLYSELMNTDTHHFRHISDIAHALKLPTPDGMCAGHEAALALNIWKYMISNGPIDEQRQILQVEPTEAQEPAPAEAMDDDDDDEQDPNDISEVPQLENQSHYGNILEDGSDYGGSDDSD